MSRFLKYSIVSFSILITILLIAPFLIPIDSYKGLLINEVKKATGRDLVIDGSIKLTFLPKPTVTLEKLKISSMPEAQESVLLDIEDASASLSIASLLVGKIVISNVELNKPIIKLETLKNGRGTWEFDKITNSSEVFKEPNKEMEVATKLPFYVEKIKIKNGQIEYLKGNDRTNIDNISIDLGIDDLLGPINFAIEFNALDQNININGKIKEFGQIIPIVADIKIGLEKLNILGNIDVANGAFSGNIESQGLLKNLIPVFADPQITKNTSQDYKLMMPIFVNKEKIEIRDTSLTMGKLDCRGNAIYSIAKSTGNLNLIFNQSNLSIHIDSSNTTSGLMTNKIDVRADSFIPVFDALEIVANIPQSLNRKFTLGMNGQYKDQEIILDNISIILGNANLKGFVKLSELSNKPSISYDLKTDSGSSLINLFKEHIPITLSEVRIKGTTIIDQKLINTNSTISTTGANIDLKGTIDLRQGINPSMSVVIWGYNLKQTIQQLLNKNSLPPIGQFSISTMIEGDLSKALSVKLNRSSVTIGADNTVFSGDTILTLNKQKPILSMNLQLSTINLNSLNNTSNVNIEPKTIQKSQNLNRSYWSDDKIDMSSLGLIDGIFNISIDKLTKESLVFDNIKTKIQLTNGIMKFDSVAGNLYGGKLDGFGQISNNGINFKLDFKEAKLKNIASQSGKIKITQGIINFNSDVKTYGTSLYQYMNNLSGNVNLSGYDGKISGFNLQRIIDSLNNPKNLETVLRAFKESFSSGETQFKNFDTILMIKNGIGDLTSCKLSGDGANITAKGQINFPKYLMDIKAAIKLDINTMPPFSVSLFGPIDNPERKFDIKALQQHLVQNVLSNVLDNIKNGKTNPKDILKNVVNFGNKKNNNPKEQEQNTKDAKQTDQDQLKTLMKKGLKGLFK